MIHVSRTGKLYQYTYLLLEVSHIESICCISAKRSYKVFTILPLLLSVWDTVYNIEYVNKNILKINKY